MRLPGLCEDYLVESFSPVVVGREAALAGGGSSRVSPSETITAGDSPAITRSAAAAGRRWLAADCALNPRSRVRATAPNCDPANLRWDSVHELWSWPHSGPSPSFSPAYPFAGDPLSIIVADPAASRIAVGSFYGFVRSPHIACTGGPRRRDIVGLYDCDSRPGDCGSLVLSRSGVVGLHAGTLRVNGRQYNAFYPFVLTNAEPPSSDLNCESETRHGRKQHPGGGGSAAAPRAVSGPLRVTQVVAGARESRPQQSTALAKIPRPVKPAPSGRREAGIVGMSPAPSTLPSRDTRAADGSTSRYVEVLMNPWGAAPVRLPDHVVVPTSLARFVANRTLTIGTTGQPYDIANGPNLLFALCNRLSPAQAVTGSTDNPIEVSQQISLTTPAPPAPGGVTTTETNNVYSYTPGCILTPVQWGGSGYPNPQVAMYYDKALPSMGVWGDDFGASQSTSVQFMSAYRTLSMAIRVRIIGLPNGQFMTPGKVYFAQVRCDHTDLPVTEQDFVTLEQLGRASHVSADAIREAGSKTVFYTPDSALKFSMTSNFLQPPGVFGNAQVVVNAAGGGVAELNGPMRLFPGAPISAQPAGFPTSAATDFTRNIMPYNTTGNTTSITGVVADGPFGTSRAMGDAADSANADSTTYLFVAYFGAAAGVVLELDYATVVEYIPTKTSPGGIEALVQLPDSSAMDAIFAAAAVLSEARPTMIQQPGDLTIAAPMRGSAPSRESLQARRNLTAMATRSRGRSYREGFWDFDWLKKGSLGNGALNWDFSDGPKSSKR